MNKFRIWTFFEFEQISNLNKIWIWTIFKFEQFSNLNNFRIWTTFEFSKKIQITFCLISKIVQT
jgi:hypothetical protein